jgi:hypothetical protein
MFHMGPTPIAVADLHKIPQPVPDHYPPAIGGDAHLAYRNFEIHRPDFFEGRDFGIFFDTNFPFFQQILTDSAIGVMLCK